MPSVVRKLEEIGKFIVKNGLPPAKKTDDEVAHEVFAFGMPTVAELSDLPALTTVATFHWPPRAGLVDAAHAKGIKVVRAFGCAWPPLGSQLGCELHDLVARRASVRNLTASIVTLNADGVNVDIEGYNGPPEDLTTFLYELRSALPANHSVSIDVSAWPINPHYKKIKYGDGYDYKALAKAADFLVVMGYDMQYIQPCSNRMGNCSAPTLWSPLANSPLAGLRDTVAQFRTLGVAASSLVMALPFYGRDFPCQSSRSGDECQIWLSSTGAHHEGPPAAWPCEGCPSHVPGGIDPIVPYSTIEQMLATHSNSSTVRTDAQTASKFFEYVNKSVVTEQGRRHQIWFDDPDTLRIKSRWARSAGL
eukprot:SAG11_NODE_7305_length_1164_cov_1.785915_1_plen_362_part_10